MSKELKAFDHDGAEVVDSRDVARMVEKQHKDLLRDIRGYIKILEESNERKFAPVDFFIPSTYQDEKGETRPCYLITKKGCDMVANKMTGEKGVLFTAAYVTAFENMRTHIQSGKAIPDTAKAALAEAKLNNSRARLASVWLKLANINPIPEYKQICAHHASVVLTGGEALPLPEVKERTYTATEAGELLGVSAYKIGLTANKYNLKTPEYGVKVWDKAKNSAKQVESWRYNEKGIARLGELLGK